MNKRSQAALEFLTTYAWAFLVILIMVGALAYFGILNPSKLLPERCSFGSEIECRDFQLSASTGTIKLKMVNNAGEAISVSGFNTTSEGDKKLVCTMTVPASAPTVTQGGEQDFTLGDTADAGITCLAADWTAAGFTAGQKGKVSVTLTYNTVKSGATYPHKVEGEIYATVQ